MFTEHGSISTTEQETKCVTETYTNNGPPEFGCENISTETVRTKHAKAHRAVPKWKWEWK